MAATARLFPVVLALSVTAASSLAPAAALGQAPPAGHVSAAEKAEARLAGLADVDDAGSIHRGGAEHLAPGGGTTTANRRPNFMFGHPRVTLGLRAGISRPRAQSDIFDFITTELTLDRRDFDALSLAGEADIWLGSRLDAVVGIGYSSASADSEYRGWEDAETGQPITQRSTLRQVPITAGLKYYLTRRGESIGQFAWIPARSALYVGGGGGFLRHSFRQAGEFVEFDEDGVWIIDESYKSTAWSPAGHVFAGADYSLGPRTVVSAEARHSWSSADLSRDFDGFEPIDLSGLQFTMGIRWRL